MTRRSWLVKARFLACALGLLLFSARAARADSPPLTLGDGYRISVLTMGPGDPFVTLFGHDAFLVERAGLPPLVYNFGMYTEAAIAPQHVLGGTLRYFLHVDRFESTVALYEAQNRSVLQQVLALDLATADRLAAALSLNSRPANSSYAYDFARDNCTTRVRDALDKALGGALRRELRGPSALSYRQHALRFTADDPALFFLFDLGLGKSVDRPLDAWDDAFLPDRLAADLRRVHVTDANGTHPLVKSERALFTANRSPPREAPPFRGGFHALVSLSLGGLLFALGRRPERASRVAFGLACALLGVVVAGLGIFVLLLLLTDVHAASHDNFNLLVCPPWALGMLWTGLAFAFGGESRARPLARVAARSALISFVGVLVASAYGQDVLRVALLITPLLSGAWLGARANLRRG